jgi:DNA gyrase subunit A
MNITNDSVAGILELCYLDYAKFIITNRSLPYFFDGLKQINRRLLWVLHNDIKKSRVKCARVVGDTMGKYHPHGDQSTYLALVRMMQYWNMRFPLAIPQGNVGDSGGSKPAQMRYTECSLSPVGASFFLDFDREIIPMKLTYDRAGFEPVFLPSRFPNLLMNGSTGIAIGISTNIPPHRCCELFDGLIHLLKNPQANLDDMMQIIKGPDFPCKVLLSNQKKVRDIYATGEGSFVLRAPCEIDGNKLIFKSIPYGTSKDLIMAKLMDCKSKGLIPIVSVSDESTGEFCLVIKIHNDADINVAKSLIYKHTQLSHSFSNKWFALDERGTPRLFNLMSYLRKFNEGREKIVILQHRNKLYRHRAQLAKYLGYIITLENPEQIITILKKAKSKQEMRDELMALSCKIPQGFDQSYLDILDGYCRLSPVQVDYIIELKLHQIANFKKQELLQEIDKLQAAINNCVKILNNDEERLNFIIQQYKTLRDKYHSPRRTTIIERTFSKDPMDLIEPEDVIISISKDNYIKQVPLKKYSSQRAGGRGLTNSHSGLKIGSNTREIIMFFTDRGRVFKKTCYSIPSCERGNRGRALINLLPNLEKDEKIKHICNLRKHLGQQKYIIFAFSNGNIRKNKLDDFKNINRSGKIYNKYNDSVVSILFANDEDHLYLITQRGKSIRFAVGDLNLIQDSRSARGVRGISCDPNDKLVSCTLISQEGEILIVSENAIGKKTDINEFRPQKRGGKGMFGFKVVKRSGLVAGAVFFSKKELSQEVMLVNSDGRTIRVPVNGIPKSGRNTSGNKIMQAMDGGKIVNIIPCDIY